MAVNLYTGTVGIGKTYQAIESFSYLMKQNKNLFTDSFAFFIVPEQFSVDIERKILEKENLSGFIGSEVISFNRLVHRIVSNTGVKLGVKTTKSLCSMLMMSVLHKNSKELVYFKDCENNPSCIDFLYNAITELQKNDISPEFLKNISKNEKEDTDDQTIQKIKELSLILQEYDKILKDDKFFDSEIMTNFAINEICQGKTELSNSTVFVDSFVGFTHNEIRLLKAIAAVAKDVNIYLFDQENNDSPIFSCPKKTILQIIKEFDNDNQKVTNTNLVGENIEKTRFKNAPELYFLSNNYGSFKTREYNGENNNSIIVTNCPDFYHEIECCAKNIQNLLSNGFRPSEIAVVTPSLDENHYIISSVFREYNIPCFVDMRADMSAHPAILFVDSFLKIIGEDFKIEYVLKFVKTGLFKRDKYSEDDVDKFENLLLKFNVDNLSKWKRLIDKFNKKKESTSFLTREEVLAIDFFETINTYKNNAPKMSKVQEVLKEILDLMKEAEIEAEIKNRSKDAERTFAMVWNSYVDIINECSIGLGDVEIKGYKKLHKYVRELLMAAVTGEEVAVIPSAGSFVQVGDIDRSRYIDKKVMMILGANEGKFPKPCQDTGFIGDPERDLIAKNGGNISYNSTERSFLSQFNIYGVMLSARDKLYISYSRTNEEGKEISKANALKRISKMFRIKEVDYKANSVSKKESPFESCEIDEKLVRELLNIKEKYTTSISNVESYDSCPYGFFLEKVLKLKERETGLINAGNMGTLMHAMFERGVPMSMEQNNGIFDDTNLTNWQEYIKKAFDDFAKDEKNSEVSYLFDNSSKNRFLVDRALRFAADEGTKMCELSKNTGFNPALYETTFGRKDSLIPAVSIKVKDFVAEFNGIIDRIDVKEENGKNVLSVVDYKQRYIKTKDVINGIDLQLSMYYSALKSGLDSSIAEKLGEIAFVHSISYYRYGMDYDKENLHSFSAIINEDVVAKDDNDSFQTNVKNKEFCSLEKLEKDNQEKISASLGNMVSGKFPKEPADYGNKSQCDYCACKNICKYKNKR